MEGDSNKALIRDYERPNLNVSDADAQRADRKARVRNASVSNSPRTRVLENQNTPRVVAANQRREGK